MKTEVISIQVVRSLNPQASCSNFFAITELTTSSSLAIFSCFLLFISKPNVLTYFLDLDQIITRNAWSLRDVGILFEVMKS